MLDNLDKGFLASYEPGEFIAGLERKIQPCYEARVICMKEFFRAQKENFINTLPYRCWNEKTVVDFSALDLLEMAKEESFDPQTYSLVSRQLEDETKHYVMLSRIYEKHTGTRLKPSEIKPLKTQVAQLAPLMTPGAALKRAMDRFVGEGISYYVAKVTAEELIGRGGALDEIGRAYEVITKDEWFHKKLGEFLLTKFATTEDVMQRIEEMSIRHAFGGLRMWMEMYGYSKEAVEIYKNHFGELEPL